MLAPLTVATRVMGIVAALLVAVPQIYGMANRQNYYLLAGTATLPLLCALVKRVRHAYFAYALVWATCGSTWLIKDAIGLPYLSWLVIGGFVSICAASQLVVRDAAGAADLTPQSTVSSLGNSMALALAVVVTVGALHGSGLLDQLYGESTSLSGLSAFEKPLDTSGPATLSNKVVLWVYANEAHYWRASSLDHFDGRTWTRSIDADPLASYPDPAEPEMQRLASGARSGTRGARIDQYVEVVSETRGDVLVAAAQPTSVSWSDLGGVAEYYDGTLQAGNLEVGDGYWVTSYEREVPAERLRTADGSESGLRPGEAETYLQVSHVSGRVVELSNNITAGETTTYGKVQAVDRWMAANLIYSLDFPELRRGENAVDTLLFESRQGYCQQMATAATILLRLQGVPARLARGYTAGEYHEESGAFVVRARNAHAWVEVYYPGIGWQLFDPTASLPTPEDLPSVTPQSLPLDAGVLLIIGAVPLGLIGLGGLVAVVHGRTRPDRPATAENAAGPPDQAWAAVIAARLDEGGARRGRARHLWEPAPDYVDALVAGPWPDTRLRLVGEAITAALFAPDGASPALRAAAELALAAAEVTRPDAAEPAPV